MVGRWQPEKLIKFEYRRSKTENLVYFLMKLTGKRKAAGRNSGEYVFITSPTWIEPTGRRTEKYKTRSYFCVLYFFFVA